MSQDSPSREESPVDDEPPPRKRSELGLIQWLKREFRWWDAFLKRWLFRMLILCAHITILILACWCIVWGMSRGRHYSTVEDVPVRYCGVVLGCVSKVAGVDNPFFTERINAAAELFHASKVQFLVVSGDNSKNGYNEPADMKAALIKKGVPAERIYCDYAGLRTLDSVIRGKEVFGQMDYTLVSQKFHNQRALYIARRKGLRDVIAFNAKDAPSDQMASIMFREVFARVRAIYDVDIRNTPPKHLGSKVRISEKNPPVDAPP